MQYHWLAGAQLWELAGPRMGYKQYNSGVLSHVLADTNFTSEPAI